MSEDNSRVHLEWKTLNQEIVACRRCPRLVVWREQVAATRRKAYFDWQYWGKPVPGFGDIQARLLAVGLAPGAHGSNRTGRMFTGDASGDFLFPALYRAGFASQPVSCNSSDGLSLNNLFISALCRCVPPDNKPELAEIVNCRNFLLTEMNLLNPIKGIVALGRVAFEQVLGNYRSKGCFIPAFKFVHAGFYRLGEGLPWLLASYHPSRQNTQTGRLTTAMFDYIWLMVKEHLQESSQ